MVGYNMISSANTKDNKDVKEYVYAQKYRVYPDGRMYPIGTPFPIGKAKTIIKNTTKKKEKVTSKGANIGEVRTI